ncbi:hypothetical protein AB0O91_30225 [Kitasatospora sp. NPDC089797]|uniref:hypothetical protein n=1 Tax=Kitasatospora sp. NPDC089797 TaxID=3155298 RepID=UPI003418C781
MSGDPRTAPGDHAAALVARTGIPVLLLVDQPASPTLTAGTGGDPRRYTSTTALYDNGVRTEVHAPGGPTPARLVRQALPGAPRTGPSYLATPGALARAVEARHDGLTARAATWNGWTLLQLTHSGSGFPALRLIGADSLPTGRPGHRPRLSNPA